MSGWFLVIIFFIVLIFIGVFVVLSRKSSGTNSITPCSQDLTGLQDISQLPTCSNLGTLKYDRDILSGMTLAPFSTYYLNVCIPYCTNFSYSQNTCTSNDTNFNTCVGLISPVNCQGNAKPLAISNGIAYYGYQAGNACSS